ncbi:hypothetical protein [Mechercharimyces sp. CAU 1602]|uniref:hypothetical protein n=1 Tax=Mechercharimyces sp. CAU 1602 TaxID=2973933 RepID=UPI0021631040|nr:hypothetical protein [Mechercharimyces sp. CAU 1602]MCS1351416.1 hypothetical protein [Mechercharimyces sp. CAU 1602]
MYAYVYRRVTPILIFTLFLGLSAGCGGDESNAEEAAIQFYKSTWVEGDFERASSMLLDANQSEKLSWRVEETKKDPPTNTSIQIAISPLDVQTGYSKTFLIHRPDKRDYKVSMQYNDRKWKVKDYKQTYSLKKGGYISKENYERLSQENSGKMKWKTIENP